MTAMLPSELAQDCTTDHDDELHHIVCCHDDNRTMCGLDATYIPWTKPGDALPPCVVCADLDEGEADEWCTCSCCVDSPIGYEVT